MTNKEIINICVNGINAISDKHKRQMKILAVRQLIETAECLGKRDKQAIWDKVGKKI